MTAWTVPASERLRDVARRGLQSAAAATAAYAAMHAMGRDDQAFIALLSAAMVVQPSADGTAGVAAGRIAAALAGSALGVFGVLLVPMAWGPLPVLLIAGLLVGGAPALRESWSFAMVPALALALNARDETGIETAVDQLVALAVGLGLGLLASAVIWPERAARRLARHERAALRALAGRLDAVADRAGGRAPEGEAALDAAWAEAIGRAAGAAALGPRAGRPALEARVAALREARAAVLMLDRVARRDPGLAARARLAAEARDAARALSQRAEGEPAGPVPPPPARDDAGDLAGAARFATADLARALDGLGAGD